MPVPPAVFPVSSCILSPSLSLVPSWMEADWSPSLAVALSLCILAGAVAKECPKLWGPSLPHPDFPPWGQELGCPGWQEKKAAPGHGLLGMPEGTGAPEVPPASRGLTKCQKHRGGFGLAVWCLLPERRRQSAIRKHSRHPPSLSSPPGMH